MQNENTNAAKKPETAPKDPAVKRELTEEELASIAAGKGRVAAPKEPEYHGIK